MKRIIRWITLFACVTLVSTPSVKAQIEGACRADINGDTTVNIQDFSILLNFFGKSVTNLNSADITRDGVVNIQDFSILQNVFGQSCGTNPEPSDNPNPDGEPPVTFNYIPASQASYVVSPTGNDSNSGRPNAPFRTIKKAASVAQAGDVVVVKAGVYNEGSQIQINGTGTANNYVTFQSETKGVAIIEGYEAGFRPAQWYGDHSQGGENGNDYVRLIGFTIRNARQPDRFFVIRPSDNWQIIDFQINNVSAGINIRGHNVLVMNTNFDGVNGPDAHSLVGVQSNNIHIYNTHWQNVNSERIIMDTGGSAITKFLYTDNLLVENSSGNNNRGPGLWLDWDNNNYTIRNSEFSNNISPNPDISWMAAGLWLEVNPHSGPENAQQQDYSNTISHVYGNTFKNNSGPGLGIFETHHLEVHDNYFEGNNICWELRNMYRKSDGSAYVGDLNVHNNTCVNPRFTGVYTSVWDFANWPNWNTTDYNVVMDRNTFNTGGKPFYTFLNTVTNSYQETRDKLGFELNSGN